MLRNPLPRTVRCSPSHKRERGFESAYIGIEIAPRSALRIPCREENRRILSSEPVKALPFAGESEKGVEKYKLGLSFLEKLG